VVYRTNVRPRNVVRKRGLAMPAAAAGVWGQRPHSKEELCA